jgi:predicted TIM-barrel fold metal-dependent hydrolase
VIAIEEHYQDPDLVGRSAPGASAQRPAAISQRLDDFGTLRLKEMDAAGIDVQVISHRGPSPQDMDAATAVRLARSANDRLHDIVSTHPTRFAGFSALPTPDPDAAADELERTVTTLGFKGGMVHGLTNGRFLDDRRFRPLLERAAALDVPLYLHAGNPPAAVVDAYYGDYAEKYPLLLRAGWSYTVETATQAIRLVLSGVFDEFPRLTVILGHLGEALPFSLWRINRYLQFTGQRGQSFREVFCAHFHITTSGHFSSPALQCALAELGADRILFAVDWPYESYSDGMAWIRDVPLTPEERSKILSRNAARLLHI